MHTTRSLRLALAVPALAAALTACGGGSGTVTASGTAGPAGVSTTTPSPATTTTKSTSAPATTTSTSSGTSGSGSSGACPSGGSIPSGAGQATTSDLDGDGKKDTIWLADSGSTRKLGVQTASGAVFSTSFSSAAPQAASAVAGIVDGETPVILLDTGRSVSLYTVSDCKIVVTQNPQGEQYTFDKGFTGFGTGVGCPAVGSDQRLVGYDAKSTSGSKYTVTRTVIDLSSGGTKASNGTKTTLGTGLSGSSSTVRTAQSVSCGSGGAAHEPQS